MLSYTLKSGKLCPSLDFIFQQAANSAVRRGLSLPTPSHSPSPRGWGELAAPRPQAFQGVCARPKGDRGCQPPKSSRTSGNTYRPPYPTRGLTAKGFPVPGPQCHPHTSAVLTGPHWSQREKQHSPSLGRHAS